MDRRELAPKPEDGHAVVVGVRTTLPLAEPEAVAVRLGGERDARRPEKGKVRRRIRLADLGRVRRHVLLTSQRAVICDGVGGRR